MRTLIVTAGIVAAVALAAVPASAQLHETLRFTAPFPFVAGHTQYPAGQYTLTTTEQSPSLLALTGGLRAGFIMVDPAGRPLSADITSSSPGDAVVFERRNGEGEYVLCQVWQDGTSMGDQVAGTGAWARREAASMAHHGMSEPVVLPASRAR
ncbi:MAG: hypothetical protein R2752_21880 [Vicinamibacterales bacterium]